LDKNLRRVKVIINTEKLKDIIETEYSNIVEYISLQDLPIFLKQSGDFMLK
jgi:hypothetical protein